jgi:hypothetical protein
MKFIVDFHQRPHLRKKICRLSLRAPFEMKFLWCFTWGLIGDEIFVGFLSRALFEMKILSIFTWGPFGDEIFNRFSLWAPFEINILWILIKDSI